MAFARLTYEIAPQSEGRPLVYVCAQVDHQDADTTDLTPADVQMVDLPSMTHCHQYAEGVLRGDSVLPLPATGRFLSLLNAQVSPMRDATLSTELANPPPNTPGGPALLY